MASNVAADPQTVELAELDRLELALRRLLDAYEAQQQQIRQAQARVAELERALQDVGTGVLDPMELGARVQELESENHTLRERLRNAEALVQRIHTRLQFLEDER